MKQAESSKSSLCASRPAWSANHSAPLAIQHGAAICFRLTTGLRFTTSATHLGSSTETGTWLECTPPAHTCADLGYTGTTAGADGKKQKRRFALSGRSWSAAHRGISKTRLASYRPASASRRRRSSHTISERTRASAHAFGSTASPHWLERAECRAALSSGPEAQAGSLSGGRTRPTAGKTGSPRQTTDGKPGRAHTPGSQTQWRPSGQTIF